MEGLFLMFQPIWKLLNLVREIFIFEREETSKEHVESTINCKIVKDSCLFISKEQLFHVAGLL